MGYGPQVATTRARFELESGCGSRAHAKRLLLEAFDGWTRSGAPWMALEAATLLGRLALETGEDVAAARSRLVSLYAGFGEGFETPRLREARALIDRLT
jgi:predicted ATPase